MAIVESREGCILHHQVMEKTTDDKIAVAIVKETQALFPTFKACTRCSSFLAWPKRPQINQGVFVNSYKCHIMDFMAASLNLAGFSKIKELKT